MEDKGFSDKKEMGSLLLTRRLGEDLVIGDGVVIITAVSMVGNNIQFKIQAPREVSIYRREVYDRIKVEQSTNGNRISDDGRFYNNKFFDNDDQEDE